VWVTNVFNAVCDAVGLKTKHAHDPGMFGYDIGASRQRESFDALTYTNANYHYIEKQNITGFHVVRDPRDIIVSGYFSHLHSHPDNIWPELRDFRPLLQNVDKSAGLMMEMEFSADWMADLRSWPDTAPDVLLVKFEDLIQDQHVVYRKIFSHLGLLGSSLPATRLDEIIEQFSYRRLSKGRKPGQEDVSNHFRKGVSGDWLNHFSPEHVLIFKQHYNDLLIKYGYESDDLWEGKATVNPSLTDVQRRQLLRSKWLTRLRKWKQKWV